MEIAAYIPMEEETFPMLITAYSIVIGLALFGTILFWKKNPKYRDALNWLIAHFIVFTVAVLFLLFALSTDTSSSMSSENFSLRIGISGVIWAISMFCLMLSIRKFIRYSVSILQQIT